MSFHRNTSPERVLAKTVAMAASLQPSAPGYQRRKSRGWSGSQRDHLHSRQREPDRGADQFGQVFRRSVPGIFRLGRSPGSDGECRKRKNACSVGTANDPAQPRGRIGSGEAARWAARIGAVFYVLWGCLPFGRGERSLCVGRAVDRHGARRASTRCVLSSFLRVGRHPDGYAPELAQRQVGYWSATRGREGNGNLNSAGVDRHSIPARPR
jgi:hypothetical protein